MTLNIEIFHIEEILSKGYSLDILALLKAFDEGYDLETLENPKSKALYSTILRKGLISDGKITTEGRSLLDFLSKTEEVKLVKKRVKDDVFLSWWSVFPGTDSFEYKNKKFQGTRALKVKKDDCKVKINKILSEGEYTIDDLIGALQLEVQQKKENSFKTGQNKLSYMQNSLTYLNQRTWEPYIELFRQQGIKKEEKQYTGGVDI